MLKYIWFLTSLQQDSCRGQICSLCCHHCPGQCESPCEQTSDQAVGNFYHTDLSMLVESHDARCMVNGCEENPYHRSSFRIKRDQQSSFFLYTDVRKQKVVRFEKKTYNWKKSIKHTLRFTLHLSKQKLISCVKKACIN